jgi:hypothetical protein
MTADNTDPRDEAWLRGLAGAPVDEVHAADAAHAADVAAGRRLRAGLDRVPAVEAPADGWADVLRRADQGVPAVLAPRAAANGAAGRWAGGVAAALLLGLGGYWWPGEDAQWRGDGAGTADAHWLSASPQADARSLAAELRAWGAEVAESTPAPQTVWLDIRCAAPCDARVGARLAELETALAPDGRLRLEVSDAR